MDKFISCHIGLLFSDERIIFYEIYFELTNMLHYFSWQLHLLKSYPSSNHFSSCCVFGVILKSFSPSIVCICVENLIEILISVNK